MVVLVLFILVVAALFMGLPNGIFSVGPDGSGWDQINLVTVILAAATIVLTGVALLIGLGAAFGFSVLRRESRRAAEHGAFEWLDQYAKTPEFRDAVLTQARTMLLSEIQDKLQRPVEGAMAPEQPSEWSDGV